MLLDSQKIGDRRMIPKIIEEALKDVEKEEKEDDKQKIEPGIRDLVVGLRRWRIITISSCEGHTGRPHSYPYVSIDVDSFYTVQDFCSEFYPIERILKAWNRKQRRTGGVIWEFDKGGLRLHPSRFPPEQQKLSEGLESSQIAELQASAKEFGIWLQNLPPKAFADWWDRFC